MVLLVSETYSASESYTKEGDYGVMVSPYDTVSENCLGNAKVLTEIKHAAKINSDGTYVLEIVIPWLTTGFEAKAGNIIGFNATFDNDIDGDGTRDSWVSWVDWNDKPYWADTQWLYKIALISEKAETEETTAPDIAPAEEIAEIPETVETAPQTFDFTVIAAVGTIVSAAGYALIKKR